MPPAAFKRLTGVSKETFSYRLIALEAQIRSFSRPTKLSLADQLLLTLTYWREYRTQFHIAQSYGVSEANVCRTIVKIENALARSGQFRLPGKKALRGESCSIEVVLVDATEQPIERPKKRQAARALQRQEEAPHAESATGNRRLRKAGCGYSFWKRRDA